MPEEVAGLVVRDLGVERRAGQGRDRKRLDQHGGVMQDAGNHDRGGAGTGRTNHVGRALERRGFLTIGWSDPNATLVQRV